MSLPRYERPHEAVTASAALPRESLVSPHQLESLLAAATISDGTRDLVRGLAALGRPATFAGGGVGIEYASLLKTAANPRYLRRHIEEAALHLRDQGVHALMVPGMSGYPIGSMYAIVADLPAILLKKQRLATLPDTDFPTGSFVIPSYTGDGDVVMSCDVVAVQDIVDRVLQPQIEAQADATSVHLQLRLAGADDIIDKATMSQAVSESGLIVGQAAASAFVVRHRARTGDPREITCDIAIAAWVTPLIKGYNRPQDHLQRRFGIAPFAGLNVTHVQIDPPAIGIDGVGVLAFDRPVAG